MAQRHASSSTTRAASAVTSTNEAPIGAVAALRECSVVFAAIIGVALLGEPYKGTRAGAALLIVGGVIALRLA